MKTGQPTNVAYTHGFTFAHDYASNYIYIRLPTRERTLDTINEPTREALVTNRNNKPR